MSSLNNYPALVLNADFRPLTYAPLSTFAWDRAIKAKYEGTHAVIAEYAREVRSPSTVIRLPSVLMVRNHVRFKRRVAFTRFNVFLAYRFRCALCGHRFPTTELTYEHLLPQSRGGLTNWENVVPACVPCNGAKGSKTLAEAGMRLHFPVYEPTPEKIDHLMRTVYMDESFFKGIHSSWQDVLYWSVRIEER